MEPMMTDPWFTARHDQVKAEMLETAKVWKDFLAAWMEAGFTRDESFVMLSVLFERQMLNIEEDQEKEDEDED
jgi:hypothetical protein